LGRGGEDKQRGGEAGGHGERPGQPAGSGASRAVERTALHGDDDPLVPSPLVPRKPVGIGFDAAKGVACPNRTNAPPRDGQTPRHFLPNLDESDISPPLWNQRSQASLGSRLEASASPARL